MNILDMVNLSDMIVMIIGMVTSLRRLKVAMVSLT